MDNTEHELLVRIDERVLQLKKDLNLLCQTNFQQNTRIDKLESWQSKIVGALILISISIPILIILI